MNKNELARKEFKNHSRHQESFLPRLTKDTFKCLPMFPRKQAGYSARQATLGW